MQSRVLERNKSRLLKRTSIPSDIEVVFLAFPLTLPWTPYQSVTLPYV